MIQISETKKHIIVTQGSMEIRLQKPVAITDEIRFNGVPHRVLMNSNWIVVVNHRSLSVFTRDFRLPENVKTLIALSKVLQTLT